MLNFVKKQNELYGKVFCNVRTNSVNWQNTQFLSKNRKKYSIFTIIS